MAKSTGPILAIGGVTILNDFMLGLGVSDIDWRVPVATAFAAAGFAMLEKLNQPLAVGVAWVALVTTLFVRMPAGNGGSKPTLIDTMLHYWNRPA